MARSGAATREKILDAAHALILDHGFAATSIDSVIEKAGITKGAFFYHFKSKAELAHVLIRRYADHDHALLEEIFDRAERLSRDPLQQILIAVGLLIEMMSTMEEPAEGCLFASFCYERELFDDDVHKVCAGSMLAWRKRLAEKLRAAAAAHPPRMEIDADALADHLVAIVEGAYVVSKTLRDPAVVAQQAIHYRNYIELLFSPKTEP